MSAWKPTDEQIQSATWAVYSFDDETWKRLHWRRRVDYFESVAELFASPAFQSIIRAAQAEAWDEGYGDDNDVQTPRKNPYRSES